MAEVHEDVEGAEHPADHQRHRNQVHSDHELLLLGLQTREVDDPGAGHSHLIEDLHNSVDPNVDPKEFGEVWDQQVFDACAGAAKEESPNEQNEKEDVWHERGEHDDLARGLDSVLDDQVADVNAKEVQDEQSEVDAAELLQRV